MLLLSWDFRSHDLQPILLTNKASSMSCIVLFLLSDSLFMCCGLKHTPLVDENLISLKIHRLPD